MDGIDDPVTIREASDRLGVRLPRIQQWVWKRRLAARQDRSRAGKPYLVSLAAVAKLAAAFDAKRSRVTTKPLPAKYCRSGLEPDPACGPDPVKAVAAVPGWGLAPHDHPVLAARRERLARLRAA